MTLVQLPNEEIITDPKRRHVFTYFFDVFMGSPNGDPNHPNNFPRQDPRTRRGEVTDGCQKRWIRDTAEMLWEGRERYQIFVRSRGRPLNALLRAIDQNLHNGASEPGEEVEGGGATATLVKATAKKKRVASDMRQRRDAVVDAYWDTRMFGQVLATGDYPGESVKGPVQIVTARSVHPIEIMDMKITRVVRTREKEKDEASQGEGTFGHKPIIHYALYQALGFYNTPFARSLEDGGTGVTSQDLVLLWTAIQSMFELQRSEAKGMLSFRGLYIFSQQSQFGNEHAHKLFERVQARLQAGLSLPQEWRDYTITADDTGLPETITLTIIPG